MAKASPTSKNEAAILRDLTLRLLFVDTEAARLDEEVRRYRFRVWALILVTAISAGAATYGAILLSLDDIYGFAFVYPAGLVGMLTVIGWVLLAKELNKWVRRREEFRNLTRRYSRNP